MSEIQEVIDLKKAVWHLEHVCTELKDSRHNDLKNFSQNLSELHKETQRFMSHLDDYEKMNAKIGPTISHYIKEATEHLSASLNQKFGSQVEEILNPSLHKLEKSSYQASQILDRTKIALTRRMMTLSFAFCLGSLITSLGAFWLVPFKFTPSFNHDMLYTYSQGLIVKNAMNSLSPEGVKNLKKLLKMSS